MINMRHLLRHNISESTQDDDTQQQFPQHYHVCKCMFMLQQHRNKEHWPGVDWDRGKNILNTL